MTSNELYTGDYVYNKYKETKMEEEKESCFLKKNGK
ncbi:hypothetical protein [Streptococcus equi]